MRAVDIIRKKRDGGRLAPAEIAFFVEGVTAGTFADYQASALLMAIVLRGMDDEETACLTGSMVDSGRRLDLTELAGRKVDKHSTGGVGDKTSLVLAPLAAACGVIVPMMSGRGLGHTGGTLDKLEAIPGFRVDLSPAEINEALAAIGCVIVGQTAEVAPADRVLYALRDVTGTVESVPLITASIMSKKIAEGIDGLVLDVKTGRGAFMETREDARRLARSLVAVGNRAGVRTNAFITAMDAPLGQTVGNALEIVECLETLKGRGPSDLETLSVRLAAEMLVVAGIAGSAADADARVRRALSSGAALQKFTEIVARQGGDARIVQDYRRLTPDPARCRSVAAPASGYLASLDAGGIGRAAVLLGAGRSRVGDPIDHGVGITVRVKPGAELRAGDVVLDLHYRTDETLALALPLATGAIAISPDVVTPGPIVLEEIRQD
jgi:pyrimidine-nucleoside phosphorylase